MRIIIPSSNEEKEVPQEQGEFWIGRGRSCEIVIPSASVSRNHLLLKQEGDIVRVKDHSSYGTFERSGFNKSRLPAGEWVELKLGTQLWLGGKDGVEVVLVPSEHESRLPEEDTIKQNAALLYSKDGEAIKKLILMSEMDDWLSKIEFNFNRMTGKIISLGTPRKTPVYRHFLKMDPVTGIIVSMVYAGRVDAHASSVLEKSKEMYNAKLAVAAREKIISKNLEKLKEDLQHTMMGMSVRESDHKPIVRFRITLLGEFIGFDDKPAKDNELSGYLTCDPNTNHIDQTSLDFQQERAPYMHFAGQNINESVKRYNDLLQGRMTGPEEAIQHNLNLMMGERAGEKGGMIQLGGEESMGGNAGSAVPKGAKRSFVCIATNFHIDPDTGKILGFTNYPYEFTGNGRFSEGSFHLIEETYVLLAESSRLPQDLSPAAQHVLDETIRRYHERKQKELPIFKITVRDENGTRTEKLKQLSIIISKYHKETDIDLKDSTLEKTYVKIMYAHWKEEQLILLTCQPKDIMKFKNKSLFRQKKEVLNGDILQIGKSLVKIEFKSPEQPRRL